MLAHNGVSINTHVVSRLSGLSRDTMMIDVLRVADTVDESNSHTLGLR
jgi:hypothetical protein